FKWSLPIEINQVFECECLFLRNKPTEVQTKTLVTLLLYMGSHAWTHTRCKGKLTKYRVGVTQHLERPVGTSAYTDIGRFKETQRQIQTYGKLVRQAGRRHHRQLIRCIM